MDNERVRLEDADTSPSQSDKTKQSINSIPSDNNSLIENFVFDMEHEKRLLERLSHSEESTLSPKFHNIAKKDKFLTPSQLIERVRSELSEKHPQLVQYLNSHKDEALDFAAYVLERVNLPEEDQRLIRQKQNKKYEKEAIAAKPPTPAQLKILDKLGFTGPIQNRQDAVEMICFCLINL